MGFKVDNFELGTLLCFGVYKYATAKEVVIMILREVLNLGINRCPGVSPQYGRFRGNLEPGIMCTYLTEHIRVKQMWVLFKKCLLIYLSAPGLS